MTVRILIGDARERLRELPDESVHCVVTSPPYYGLRDYGIEGQIGLEETPAAYIETMVSVFREVRRVLRDDGTLWLNMGDSYANDGKWGGATGGKHVPALHGNSGIGRAKRTTGLKPKDLIGMPWRVAFALQADGWWLRRDIIWSKPNPMPESVTDRPTSAHEYVFLLSKSARYFYDADAVREDWTSGRDDMRKKGIRTGLAYIEQEPIASNNQATKRVKVPGGRDLGAGAHGTIHRNGRTEAEYQEAEIKAGRNLRSVWTIATAPFPEAHFATFPPALVEPCIKAGTSERGCCRACGVPWRRVTESRYENPGNRTTNGPRSLAQRHETAGFAQRLEKRVETCGWSSSCDCGREPVPCTVLDPFLGAGTTALVADRLGRDCIGIELNPQYAELARLRLERDAGLFADTTVAAQ